MPWPVYRRSIYSRLCHSLRDDYVEGIKCRGLYIEGVYTADSVIVEGPGRAQEHAWCVICFHGLVKSSNVFTMLCLPCIPGIIRRKIKRMFYMLHCDPSLSLDTP